MNKQTPILSAILIEQRKEKLIHRLSNGIALVDIDPEIGDGLRKKDVFGKVRGALYSQGPSTYTVSTYSTFWWWSNIFSKLYRRKELETPNEASIVLFEKHKTLADDDYVKVTIRYDRTLRKFVDCSCWQGGVVNVLQVKDGQRHFSRDYCLIMAKSKIEAEPDEFV